MSDCGCGSGCANGCGQPIKIITEQGIQGEIGVTGATGATGVAGADGDDGLGYDNMTSVQSLNLSLGLPTSLSAPINIGKAVTVGTRLRYTKTSDLTQWIEGVATSYTVATGACSVDFDLKSTTAVGSHTDWSVTVIGEPGTGGGFDSIDNVGTGAEVYKGLNSGVAELRSIIGLGALDSGVAQLTNEIQLRALTEDSEFEVFPGGTAISPSFSYSPGIGESLISPGSISATSNVRYYDWFDFIYLTFHVTIENFQLSHGTNKWCKDNVTFNINGLPTGVYTGVHPQVFSADMYSYKVADPLDQEFTMERAKSIQLITSANAVGFKNSALSTKIPTSKEDINIVFYGQILIRKG